MYFKLQRMHSSTMSRDAIVSLRINPCLFCTIWSFCFSLNGNKSSGSRLLLPFGFRHFLSTLGSVWYHLRHTDLNVSRDTPPVCCSNLLFLRGTQSEECWLKGIEKLEHKINFELLLIESY